MNFGEQVKKLRKERNLTQQAMADMLNVSRQAVSNWENDKNLPDIEMLITMAQVFRLTLDELILGGTTMNNMTEKLIRDGSTNRKIKMNLTGIIIGGALLALGFVSLAVGTFTPPEMEVYFGMACSALMACGVITFLVMGVKNLVDLFRDREEAAEQRKLLAVGGGLLAAGLILYGVTLTTGVISGLFGLCGIIAGIAVTVIAALKAK